VILTNVSAVKELLSRHGFKFAKPLGQNFLVNPSVCPRMARGLSGNIVEIGAGAGVLTRELANTAEKVIVVEIDETLGPVLAETLAGCDNVEIIWGDALKTDLRALIEEKFGGGEAAVCANLPYYAAARIITRMLEARPPISSVTVMVQEEVAQRITALPNSKQYGVLSVVSRFYGNPKLLFKVPRGSFIPIPNVDGAVIRLDVYRGKRPGVTDEKRFFRFVKAAFSERRKQLANPVSRALGTDKESVKRALGGCGINASARAQELSVDDFIRLYNKFENNQFTI
jgi:16S rRNA (adenine1518-N6/adenine1519-N6)-dimethyltransferase